MIDRLISQQSIRGDEELRNPRAVVVNAAISLLSDIHAAVIEAPDTAQTLYNIKNRRTIDSLLDLISLEGIYPALSPGVGIPIERRVRSVLQAGAAARPLAITDTREDGDLDLLKDVVSGLNPIILAGDRGVNHFVRERTFVDVICGCAELAYGPSAVDDNQNNEHERLLDQMLKMYVMVLNVRDGLQQVPPHVFLTTRNLAEI